MLRKAWIIKLLILVYAAACIAVFTVGCNSADQSNAAYPTSKASRQPPSPKESPNKAVKYKKPDKLSIMVPLYYSEPPASKNDLEKMMGEFTNTDLEIIWVPFNNYYDRLNLAIASIELPNAIAILNTKMPAFINSVRSGMFWDITDKMSKLPALNENYDPQMLKNASIDGKLYGLPRGRPLTRNGIIFRKDWLKNVGLEKKQPATLDDIYTIIKAFATKDPNRNGKDDTYGILIGVEPDGDILGDTTKMLDVVFNGGNGSIIQDGKLVPTFTTEAHLKSIKWLKRLYDEKLMNQNFATVQPSQFYEILDKEQAGLFFQTITDAHERLDNVVNAVQKRDPKLGKMAPAEAKTEIIDTIYQIQAENGEIRASTQNGFNGIWAFSKTSNKTEEDLMKILNFFDRMDKPEGQSIIYWGKEGRHWSYKNGQATMTEDSMLFSREVQPYWQLFCTNRVKDRCSIKGNVAPMYTKVYTEMESLLPYAVYDPMVPLISDTYSINGTNLDKIINDARIKFIMGMIDEAGWNAAINQWRQQGGDKLIDEYTEQYNKYGK